ncbi:MAG: stage II sporulation protein P [Eubacterium sp.]|nr:stage II sporulation protein P [Eubacterium sp.]
MKKQLLIMLLNTIIIFGCVGICLNVLPLVKTQAAAASISLVSIASPEHRKKPEISSDKSRTAEQTTNTRTDEQVMNVIGSKDSDDGYDITETPPDVKALMQKAKGKYTKKNVSGKTSEGAYNGGGTIISHGNVQIQSKIPASFYKPDIKSLLREGAELKIKDKNKPTILIYHSHTHEAYSLVDSGYYISSDSSSSDNAKNVVRVGDELASTLEKAGFKVIHDTEVHDNEYNNSYSNSRKTVEKYLEKYPSIDITIDLHRDDITYQNKTKVKPTAVVGGKKAARMMIISGCEYGSVQNFPDWEYNLRFNVDIMNKVNGMYKDLMRPILFSERRYNMFETHTSFLLEIGTDANTLDEACYSARLFGTAFADLLDEKYCKQ